MPKIEFEQVHALQPEQVRPRLDRFLSTLCDTYGLVARWTTETEVHLSRTGMMGTIQIEPERAVLRLDLSFALAPLKGRIEASLRAGLASALTTGEPEEPERIPELQPVA